MRPLAFKLFPSEFLKNSGILSKIVENHRKSQFCFLEKVGLELCQAATVEPRQIVRSVFFLLDQNSQTRVYRLVSGLPDAQLRRNRDSPMEDDDYAPPPH